jgi:hypothetical protein
MHWSYIDEQMRSFAPFLRDQFGITPPQSNHLASQIANEIRSLPKETLDTIAAADPVGAHARLEELKGFQMFMDLVGSVDPHPAVVRAQLLGISFFNPSAPFQPKARGRRGFDGCPSPSSECRPCSIGPRR